MIVDRIDLALIAAIAVVVLGAAAALFLSGARAADPGPSGSSSVFTVTDPTRGLHNMHPALLDEEAHNG